MSEPCVMRDKIEAMDERLDDVRAEHRDVLAAINSLRAEVQRVYTNGLSSLGQRVATIEGKTDSGKQISAKASENGNDRDWPKWKYMLLGAALLGGGEGIRFAINLLGK